MIVAKDGGTPVILDDALGYTEPGASEPNFNPIFIKSNKIRVF
jgi:hypothetical protein